MGYGEIDAADHYLDAAYVAYSHDVVCQAVLDIQARPTWASNTKIRALAGGSWSLFKRYLMICRRPDKVDLPRR
jgi:hypothetical protein